MGHQDVWRTEPNGSLTAEVDGLRLEVPAPASPGGAMRFLVIRRDGNEHSQEILASGTEEGLRAAMKAAARMAERILARPLGTD